MNDCKPDLQQRTHADLNTTNHRLSGKVPARKVKRSQRRLAVRIWVILCFCLVTLCLPASTRKSPESWPAPDPTAGSTYVGADTCNGCHAEVYAKSFANTPHGALLKEGKHGCEDCHGPGSAHVAGGGDVTKIVVFSKLSPAQISQRCMSCHQSNAETNDFSQSVHLSQGVSCLSCHSPHHAVAGENLLLKLQPLLCYGCHAQQKDEFALPFRHRVDVGLILCSDCHNPHGSFQDAQLREADGGMEICTKCHTEKAGPFTFEHMPVKQDGCTSCHTPHGSTNPRLLRVAEINMLCLQCHSPIANRDTPEPLSFHDQSIRFQACTMCHTQIHGSNFNEFFFR